MHRTTEFSLFPCRLSILMRKNSWIRDRHKCVFPHIVFENLVLDRFKKVIRPSHMSSSNNHWSHILPEILALELRNTSGEKNRLLVIAVTIFCYFWIYQLSILNRLHVFNRVKQLGKALLKAALCNRSFVMSYAERHLFALQKFVSSKKLRIYGQ